ncbi:hypothetical protein Q7V73_01625 [Streptococcus suis]|nr:hypothetical protein [Streptococcus suis]
MLNKFLGQCWIPTLTQQIGNSRKICPAKLRVQEIIYSISKTSSVTDVHKPVPAHSTLNCFMACEHQDKLSTIPFVCDLFQWDTDVFRPADDKFPLVIDVSIWK